MRNSIVKKICKYPYSIGCSIYHKIQDISALIDIAKTRQRIQKKHKRYSDRIKVVFIVQYVPAWEKMVSVYRNMLSDDRFEPVILCVPMNIQKNSLVGTDKVKNDTFEYFDEKGYKALNALVGEEKWLDLHELHPDIVFHTRPYNWFMPKQYTSRVIRKYALICNILYGTLTTKNLRDTVINRGYYRDVFCYFAFDTLEKTFYEERFTLGTKLKIQYCLAEGATGPERIVTVGDSVKPDESKIVMWTPRWSTDPQIGGSNFFRYKDTLFTLAKRHPEVKFIFRPHPLMFENFVRTGEMSIEEVNQYKKTCADLGNIILDETKDYSRTFWKSSFLITDLSGIVPDYYVTNHPLIFCHPTMKLDHVGFSKAILEHSYEANNETELVENFEQLLMGNDPKKHSRKENIVELFGDIRNHSINIVNILAFFVLNEKA